MAIGVVGGWNWGFAEWARLGGEKWEVSSGKWGGGGGWGKSEEGG